MGIGLVSKCLNKRWTGYNETHAINAKWYHFLYLNIEDPDDIGDSFIVLTVSCVQFIIISL